MIEFWQVARAAKNPTCCRTGFDNGQITPLTQEPDGLGPLVEPD
jgi:hypothetical protein